jgi:hypothetical protein
MNKTSLSNAQKYKQARQLALAAKAETEELFDVPVSSGFVFKCRKPILETYVVNGLMPMSLTETLAKAMNGGKLPEADENEIASTLQADEVKQLLVFSRELVRDICASPRIVENPRADEDAIEPKDLSLEDFRDLVQWGMKNLGGAEAARLGNFRDKSDLNAGAGTDSKKRKPKTK